MKILIFSAMAFCVLSCQIMQNGKKKECGIGVRNKGVLDTRAISVVIDKKVYSFGGIIPGGQATMMNGYFVSAHEGYPPIKLEYGLMSDESYVKSHSIDYMRPSISVFNASMPPTMMIYIYPGISGKSPHIVWEK
jgi:hypothetical protein